MDKTINIKGKGFPVELLQPHFTVLSLFAAAFGGEQDIKFLHEAGISKVEMVDNDRAKLDALAVKFPGYTCNCTDAFAVIDACVNANIRFDIVISDQWTSDDNKINDWYLDRLKRIGMKYLIVSVNQIYIDSLESIPPGEYYYRSDFRGGVYWRVIEC
jgi:hypothetical protein